MLVAFMCFDKPGHVDLRLSNRPRHLTWIQGAIKKVVYAGPMLSDDGQTPTGSLIVAEFESVDAARAFQKTDPYDQAGLFERVIVTTTRKVLPA